MRRSDIGFVSGNCPFNPRCQGEQYAQRAEVESVSCVLPGRRWSDIGSGRRPAAVCRPASQRCDYCRRRWNNNHPRRNGAPGFVPVITKLGVHAERTDAGVTGGFECLALAPESSTGAQSGQFTVNAMYVTGRVTGASVDGDTATLTGTANVTGLGAGSSVPFTFVMQRGGPGATSVLTVSGLIFHEVLLEGGFQVGG